MNRFKKTVARRYLLLLVTMLGVSLAAWAETPDLHALEAKLKQREERVQQISRQLDADDVSFATLDSLLQTLLGYQDNLQNDTETLKAALDDPTQRLDDLGPPPAEGQPAESADIAKLRKSLTDEVSHLTGLSKEADLTRASVDRLVGRIRDLQGARFRSSITKRGVSPFSSEVWTKAAAEIPPALDHLTDHVVDWWRDQRSSGNWAANLVLLAASLVGAIGLLLLPRWSGWRRFEAKLHEGSPPSAVAKRRRVAERALRRGLLTAGAGALLYLAAVEAGFISLTGQSFALRLWSGSVLLVAVWSYAGSVFSPRHPQWRVAQCSPMAARLLRTLFIAAFGLFVVDRIIVTGFELTGAGIELTLAQAALGNGLFAFLLWLLLDPKLWYTDGASPDPAAAPSGDSSDKSAKAEPVRPHDVLRSAGRLLALLILVATALGYVRLANFVFHRGVLLATFLIFVWSVRVLAAWGLSRLPTAKPPGAHAARGDEDSAKEHIGFWLNTGLDLALLALSVPAFLLIVGFDWLDLRRWFGLLGSDMRIGAVSVSFTDILSAVVVFLLVSIGTKWTTGVVDRKLLQRTRLEPGARDSIITLVNYTGVFIGILMALGTVGVGLSKLAIVAGALSVGIGFGLQSIVNNFVSGLILLFERPIKMGDWVVVPSGQGYVKHIGARATEIETFDRSSILIPNSELVSSAVQNWFYKGRHGRLSVDVGVSYGSDPEQVREILLDCAKEHKSILSYPAAFVRWTDFGDSALQFRLLAHLSNVDDIYEVRSDLRFAIFKAFKDAGIEIPFPQRDLHIRSDGTPVSRGAAPERSEGGEKA